ncbi:MAG: Gfo/Idh/MocA family oxidoreductase [Myxococcales bacterium]|jgi:predicted dehydrogenase
MTLKVAIVGCGKIADGHVEEIQKMPDLAYVVGVCDLEPLMAEQLAMRYRIGAFASDLDQLLDEQRPDVVHITTPPGSHAAIAKRALDAGCHVFVEKPLTPTLAATKDLLEYAARSGRKLTIGYTYLFDPPAQDLRKLLAQGALGDVVHVESFYGYNLRGPYGSAILADPEHWVVKLPGQLLHNNLDHLLNKLLEFFEDDAPSVVARGLVRRSERFGDARDSMFDELRLVVTGKETTAYGTFSSFARPAGHFLRVYGTKNTAHVDFVSRTVTLEGASSSLPSAIGRLVPAFEMAARFARSGLTNALRFARSDFHFFSGLNYLFRRFYESIRDGTPPPISQRDIVRVATLLDSIFLQLGEAKEVAR